MNRRDFLKTSAAAGAALLLGCSPRALFRGKRPNLLLVVSDALRADHLGCYGSPMPLSPAVDALAARGALFTNVMSVAPLTGASHATLMTGAYQTRHTVVDNNGAIPNNLATLAEVLTDEGYRAAAFVSNIALKPEHLAGIERGFDPFNIDLPTVERNRPLSFYRIARDTTSAASAWLTENAGTPFFLWVHYIEPHGPYELPEPELLGRVTGLPDIKGEPASLPVLTGNYQPNGIPAYQVLGDERRPEQYRRRYAARVRYVDGYLSKLLGEMDRLGLQDNTVIAFTSDHGELLGEHGYYFMHGATLTQPVLHVPLVVAGPGIPPGRRIPIPVGNADIMPALLDLLGVPLGKAARQQQGSSLTPLLRDGAGEPRPVYALSKHTMESCVRLGPLKYVRSEDGKTGREGLFDLESDPGEVRDLSAARPADAAKLKGLLDEFMAQNPGVLTNAPADPAPRLSDEDRQRLKALGYL
ncbi:MAG: sulfatase [Armatimonadota bacterium]